MVAIDKIVSSSEDVGYENKARLLPTFFLQQELFETKVSERSEFSSSQLSYFSF